MKRALLLTILHTLFCAAMLAQPDIHVTTYTIRDGLPSNVVSGIGQGSEGLIWIATWNGLCCYDGYQFTTFPGDRWGNDDALSSYRISQIKPDSQGHVWLRTYDGGLYLFDTHTCRYTNVGLLLEQKYNKTILPRNFYPLPSGHTWITDEHGQLNLRVDDRDPTNLDSITILDLTKHPDVGDYIRKVQTDQQGHEWLITNRGMIPYHRQEHNVTTPIVPTVPSNSVAGPSPFTTPDAALTTEDRFGTVWQLSKDGQLSYYDEQSHTLKVCRQLPDVDKTFIDRQGNLWTGNSHGLTHVTFHYHYIHQRPLEQGEQTRSLLCRSDGTIWAGTRSGAIGIYSANGRLSGWLSPQGRLSTSHVRFAEYIYSMLEDSQGNTWIGTKGQGLYLISRQGTVSHYLPQASDPYSISHAYIYDIDEDERGNIWIGTYNGGLNLVTRQSLQQQRHLRFIHRGNELRNYPHREFTRIRRITHDGKGNILLSCTDGLLTCSNRQTDKPSAITFHVSRHEQSDTLSLRANDVMQTLVTRDGSIYVTTLGGAIQRLVSDNLQQDNLRFTTADVLNQGNGNVFSMTEDRQGNIWIARETEINQYAPASGRLTPYSTGTRTKQVDMTEAKPCIDQQGNIWMGTLGGILTFNPRNLSKSQYQPAIVFTSLHYQGEQQSRPLINRQQLEIISIEQRNLTITFAAIDYDDNNQLQYAYRMDDGQAWNYIGHNPRISFSQLPPGRHTLTVKSTNCDGVWADNETALTIDVQPMLWERLWFRLFLLLLFIAVATTTVVTYLRHRQQLKQREERLEHIMRQYQELSERTETAATQVSESAAAESEPAAEIAKYRLEEPKIVDADEEMMDRLMKYIEQRIGDEHLKIEDMADAVGLGRTVFYGKIKELVGVSPSDFLRQIRMQRARQLITKSKLTFSEIAYSVGFTDPKYFTKCFKKDTGMTPSEYRERAGQSS